ncbi:MAG: hypothetical protein EB078_11075, partial [Proteobacteria bacterium]|nr:hypothetical protein [Pseudomonadota bacterium]
MISTDLRDISDVTYEQGLALWRTKRTLEAKQETKKKTSTNAEAAKSQKIPVKTAWISENLSPLDNFLKTFKAVPEMDPGKGTPGFLITSVDSKSPLKKLKIK